MKSSRQFVIIMGGPGSGKNYYIAHHPIYSSYHLVDVDAVRGETEQKISNIKPMLQAAMSRGNNIAHPMTGAGNTTAIINKLKLAREMGYETTVIFIDTPIDVAISNVRQRAEGGGHDVPDWKIAKTNDVARDNFEAIKNDPLVDNREIVNNMKLESLRKIIRIILESMKMK